MLRSLEVRWFFPGALPGAIVDLFSGASLSLGVPHDAGLIRLESPRIDTYVLFPGSPYVGVKYREGMFEIKARSSVAVILPVAQESSGEFASWSKISMTAERFEIGDLWPEDRGYLRYVSKRRILRKYVNDGGVTSSAVSAMPGEGCNVELVEVQLMDRDELTAAAWHTGPVWSFAFESYGTESTAERFGEAYVTPLIAILERASLGVALTSDHSLSYPAWLSSNG